jgi:hypothetical protein
MAKTKAPKKISSDQNVTPVEATVPAVSTELSTSEVAASEIKKAVRKPSIVRSESRANLVPINLEEEVRRLAYLLSERRGFEPGHETEDWLTAELEIRQRYHHQQSA